MNTNTLSLAHLSDDELLVQVKKLVQEERAATAWLLVHLAEMEDRRLHCREGCASLFSYCVEVLHLSEPAAYRRVKAARLARRFPVVLEMLAEGSIHLAALDVLAAHLTDANHVEVLVEARSKTKREVEELAARLRPLPDVPPTVRKLPEPKPVQTKSSPAPVSTESAPVRSAHESERRPIPDPNPAYRPVVAPLSPERYKIQFTAGAATYRKLRQVQELLRHRVPDGDPAAIMDTALTLLLEKLLREKTGAVARPRGGKGESLVPGDGRPAKPPAPESGEGQGKQSTTGTGEARRRRVAFGKPSETRQIPAAVKRAVWRRDEGRCAFTAANGRRCSSRGPLEFHHIEPYMLGGRASIANISLRCRTHNAYEGELQFGKRGDRRSRPKNISKKQYPKTLETLPGESSGVFSSGIAAGRVAAFNGDSNDRRERESGP